ncbi:beta-galactosidase [Chitinophagaceae bacterium LB-8]|uniref:Beta-galactosidase n=1 Tax=Paraflavisolibacter caeni TaxID=2982496 RepID=A0A9X2XZS3_9BACT|nr:beta-galactosidase [Paraflavisolibacter caeni]MCU7552649.1 beta-galactosidase [Paraflavisolibacter caeni]
MMIKNVGRQILLTSVILLTQHFSFCQTVHHSKTYTINTNVLDKKIYSGHLKLGGKNNKGDSISVNNYYVSINNMPFIPVTGEFHFSRYPAQYWDESIKKMKAGGINTVATYVFWNLHEENEGKFNWSGDRDVRKFVELCAKNNLYTIVRLGPFCHGEIRNGGLPDWLLGKPLTVRSNDPLYLSYVEKLYNEIGKELQGLFYKDGGPIIGIQIENEYQHSAAPWGLTYPEQPHDMTASERDLGVTQEGVGIAEGSNPYSELGNDHMKVLKALSIKAGMDAPLFTATGWGNAAIIPNESIPVTAAYAYPFWTAKKDLSPFFLFKDMHKDPDYAPVRYKTEDYPAFPAELGSGIMSVYTRRPIAEHKSFDAMINRCLGSGANGIGYYMYHGGSTPKGEHYYFNDEAYGLPKISYDFQAPIGEFGQVREGFHRLKLLHFFTNHFGELLAPMVTILPQNSSTLKPDNDTDLRYAVRTNGHAGFLFVNNFQDDMETTDKKNIQISINTGNGAILIPESGGFNLKGEENAIFPFNLDLNGVTLNYATAQLMMKGDDPSNQYYVFFVPEGVSPEFSFAKESGVVIKNNSGSSIEQNAKRWLVKCSAKGVSEFKVSKGGKHTKVLVVDKEFALKAFIVTINGMEHLIFSDAVVLQNGNSFEFLSKGKNNFDFTIYPRVQVKPTFNIGTLSALKSSPSFSSFTVTLPKADFPTQTRQIGQKKLVVQLPGQMQSSLNDIFLTVDYIGDTGMGFIDGELVADEFYKGIPWEIGLRKFLGQPAAKEMVFYFRPMYKDATYLVDLKPASVPDFGKNKTVLKVNNVVFTPQYKTVMEFRK